MKKSLVISEKEKYPSMGEVTKNAGGPERPPKKYAPTIELKGSQIDAFCACSLKQGDKGSGTIHWVVKSVGGGDSYGDELVQAKKRPERVVLQITHVEADEEDEDEDEEADDSPEVEAAEGEESTDEETDQPQDRVSPKDAGLE